jgi:hypothetical protein
MGSTLSILLFPLLLIGGLFAPGWLLGRLLRTNSGAAGAFLGSCALLLNLILLIDLSGLQLTRASVSAGLASICALLAVAIKLRSEDAEHGLKPRSTMRWEWQYAFIVPAAFGLIAIAVKASLDPLSGFDTPFRWDFLARQMVRQETLQFYPANTAADFLHYGWCDGIAPLVSNLYFWSYLSLGEIRAAATAPVVIAQGLLLFSLTYKLAAQHNGARAGWAAVALLTTSAIALWGVAMGQETGLTSISLVAMFWFFEEHRTTGETRWLIWAGVAAGTGALAREYGLAFILIGGIALAWSRTPRRGWAIYFLAVSAVALPWYVRNWVKTGNPLYSYDLAGMFPANPINTEYLRAARELRGLGTASAPLGDVFGLAIGLAGIPLLLGLVMLVKSWRTHAAWIAGILCVLAAWLWASHQASGGVAYSLRVLTPAIALSAAAGAPLLARWTAVRQGWILVLAIATLAADASIRSFFLPLNPTVAWWRESDLSWREFSHAAARWREHPNWAEIVRAADGRQIVVSDPLAHAVLAGAGGQPVPLFSPSVRWLFQERVENAVALDRLRKQGVRFVLLTRKNDVNDRLLANHSFFCYLSTVPPALTAPLYLVYDLYLPPLLATETTKR